MTSQVSKSQSSLVEKSQRFSYYFSWVQTNYPTYYSKFREVYDPAAEFTWQKLTVAGAFIAEKSKPARDYLDAKIPVLLEKVSLFLLM